MSYVETSKLRARFSARLSDMYTQEVPAYGELKSIVESINTSSLRKMGDKRAGDPDYVARISAQCHGAVRVGTAEELQGLRRLFALLGMHPVDFYDLAPAGLPVHATAFRPVSLDAMRISPFRMFCSLLRPELIADAGLRENARRLLASREIFPQELLNRIEEAEHNGGVTNQTAEGFIDCTLEVFRWHPEARVDRETYEALLAAHSLVADIVSFAGPHINHLTPACLNIDEAQQRMLEAGLNPKQIIEGPPARACNILLRQTAFKARRESVRFAGVDGFHAARFGEVEQRGAALTPRGREVYDRCLAAARDTSAASDDSSSMTGYTEALQQAFADFPDDWGTLLGQDLVYFRFSLANDADAAELRNYRPLREGQLHAAIADGIVVATPITYEDFLPVSAAGIFRSNLGPDAKSLLDSSSSKQAFEALLGCQVVDSQQLYSAEQERSLAELNALLDDGARG